MAQSCAKSRHRRRSFPWSGVPEYRWSSCRLGDSDKPFPFLRLPAEIRNQIYGYLLPPQRRQLEYGRIIPYSHYNSYSLEVYCDWLRYFCDNKARNDYYRITPYYDDSDSHFDDRSTINAESLDYNLSLRRDERNTPNEKLAPTYTAIMRVCKRVNEEAAHVFWTGTTLIIGNLFYDYDISLNPYLFVDDRRQATISVRYLRWLIQFEPRDTHSAYEAAFQEIIDSVTWVREECIGLEMFTLSLRHEWTLEAAEPFVKCLTTLMDHQGLSERIVDDTGRVDFEWRR